MDHPDQQFWISRSWEVNIKSIRELSTMYQSGERQVLSDVRRLVERIKQADGEWSTWVVVDEESVLTQAAELDARAQEGENLGPLHGISVGVKDIFDVRGLPTRAGCPHLPRAPAKRDAPLVAALRKAGAVILGKTVTTEFAAFDPPSTKNPWNPRHTPGGSSSGSAAAVALGMCPAALGTQTGGSISRPAAYCGVVGFKPTFGSLSRRGIVPVSPHLDHPGLFARSVQDVREVYLVWQQQKVSTTPSMPDSALEHAEKRRVRVGYFQSPYGRLTEKETYANFVAAIERGLQADFKMVPLAFPLDWQEIQEMHRCLMAVDAALIHQIQYPQLAGKYSPKFASLLAMGHRLPATDYARALRFRRRAARTFDRLFMDVDFLITPTTPSFAPADLTTTGDPSFNVPWSLAGLPTVSIPQAMHAQGLPLGLQIVGPRHQDDALLVAATAWQDLWEFQPLSTS